MFISTVWNNGSRHTSGSGYGIRLKSGDRDRYFRAPKVFLRLEGQTGDIPINTDNSSFQQDACMELRSKEIGLWLIQNSKVPWPKGHPPKLQMEPATGGRTFNVVILSES